jgi:hypothetical protein
VIPGNEAERWVAACGAAAFYFICMHSGDHSESSWFV